MEPMMRRVWTVLASTAALAAAPAFADGEEATSTAAPAAAEAPATTASGFQRTEERTPRAGTPLIANKLYPMGGRFEFTGMFNMSLGDKYTEHLGGQAAVGFHIFDNLAVEVFGGYLAGDDTGIVDAVRLTGASKKLDSNECATDTCEPQLPDMYQTTWFTGADVQWAPIYGKISAVSEYDVNFQLYLRGGAGVENIHRFLNNNSYDVDQLRFSANYGLGLRLIPFKNVAVRAELVNYAGLNPNVQEHDSTEESKCADGYLLRTSGEPACYTDFSNSTMFQVGLSFLL
jgi:outer membrane beta-barrel protein